MASQKCEAHLKIDKEYAEVMGVAEAEKAYEKADESQAQKGVGAEIDEADESQAQTSQAIDVDMAEWSQLL